MKVAAYLFARQKERGISVAPEQCVQVSPRRFRVPDIMVVLGEPGEQVFTKAPFLCIEVLSPDDRMSCMHERIRDYISMGVAYVWVLDPATRRAYVESQEGGFREVAESVPRAENPAFEIPLSEIFE